MACIIFFTFWGKEDNVSKLLNDGETEFVIS
jgi:hypothetical protein